MTNKFPAFVYGGIASVVGSIVSWLTLDGVISNTQASTATQFFMPYATLVVGVGVSALIHFAYPEIVKAEKAAETVVARYAPGEAPALERAITAVNYNLTAMSDYTQQMPVVPAPAPVSAVPMQAGTAS